MKDNLQEATIDGKRFAMVPLEDKPIDLLKQEIRLLKFTYGRSNNEAGKYLDQFYREERSFFG